MWRAEAHSPLVIAYAPAKLHAPPSERQRGQPGLREGGEWLLALGAIARDGQVGHDVTAGGHARLRVPQPREQRVEELRRAGGLLSHQRAQTGRCAILHSSVNVENSRQ